MLPSDEEDDRFLALNDLSCLGQNSSKNEFRYFVDLAWMRMLKPCLLRPVLTIEAGKTGICQTCGLA